MRADRLLSFLLLLQNRGRMTAAELAAELECSERTVYRDAEALGAAGIPIYADRGTGGGYRLMDGYRTRLTGLTAGEADSLFFTGLPGPADALGLGSELALVRLKLLAALPGELRERAERVGARFHLDATAWWRTPAATPHLAALADAVWEERTVQIGYRRFDGSTVQRTVDPLGLVLKGDTWYVLARPSPATTRTSPAAPGRPAGPPAEDASGAEHAEHMTASAEKRKKTTETAPGRDSDRQVRTYRVDRIKELTDTGLSFTRPDDFDLPALWAAWAEEFESSRYRLHTRVRLTDRGLHLLPSLSSQRTAAGAATARRCADGRHEVDLVVESVPVAVHEFSAYGADLEVIDPPELRTALAEHLRAAAARYTTPPEEAGEADTPEKAV
ncbi:helix-turn-helix transcriptional regulator [Nocardiopsis composta]|uniref:Putative DNA-binding transcriptional regulator YafY n=1 Tax=Nocardiopsis composta TaxID=157465 RepID=A0A7W8QI95_9ACTN|nr:WYL domain-containing protein [Nocardiopsis composta]MBB5430744.1 putative DNA-binding transcriptional regulator YafY [Nocardiopsis composta]